MLYTITTKCHNRINIENYVFIPKDDYYVVEVKYNVMPKNIILFDNFDEALECLRVLRDNRNKIIFNDDCEIIYNNNYWDKYAKEPKVEDLRIVKLIPEMC